MRAGADDPIKAIIDGRLTGAASGRTMPTVSPIDGTVLAEEFRSAMVPTWTGQWPAPGAPSRSGAGLEWHPRSAGGGVLRWAELIEAESLALAVLETRDMGMPIAMAEGMEIPFAVDSLRWYAEAADKLYDEIATINDHVSALITRTPLGVVGAILPWNAPAMIAAWKLGPALVTGNSVVVKPSEDASLTVLRMGELALAAGIPEGVVQVVSGGARRRARRSRSTATSMPSPSPARVRSAASCSSRRRSPT